MVLSTLRNRKSAALLSMLAVMLFIIVSNVHVHDQFSCCGESDARPGLVQNAQVSQVYQSANGHHRSPCAACEMMALGMGNTSSAHAFQMCTASTQQAFISATQRFTHPNYRNLLPSRAPPA